MREPALRELQGAFWRALTDGPSPELSRVVAPTPALAAADRVEIYAGMYVARIVDALAEDFPKLAALLGAERFAALVRDYLARHPSREPSIRHIGAALPAFVAGRESGSAADLARLEWTRLEVFDAPDAEPLGLASLRRVPEEDWPALRFALVPACARLVTAWPVHRFWSETDAPSAPERTALRVWRDGFLVYQAAMDAREERALEGLAAGELFAALCEHFADPAEAGGIVLRWLEDGILARAWRDAGDPGSGSHT